MVLETCNKNCKKCIKVRTSMLIGMRNITHTRLVISIDVDQRCIYAKTALSYSAINAPTDLGVTSCTVTVMDSRLFAYSADRVPYTSTNLVFSEAHMTLKLINIEINHHTEKLDEIACQF